MRDRPDVVVMDVHVPPIDGPELVRMVREHPPIASTPILLISAASPAELHDLAVACRADSWAPKDNPAAVAARAASLLLRRRIRKSEA
jgi:CheY-like chemotaxis protein